MTIGLELKEVLKMAFVESYTGYAADDNKNKVIIRASTFETGNIPAGGSTTITASLPTVFNDYDNIKAVATIDYNSVVDQKVICEAGIVYNTGQDGNLIPALAIKLHNVGTNAISGEGIVVNVILVGQ